MKTKLFMTGLLFAAFICSCTTPKYLPKPTEIDVNQYGSYITVIQKSGKYIEGELLAIDSNNLIILQRSDSNYTKAPLIIPVNNVSHFTIKYAQPKHYGWSIPVYTLATISHGFFLIFTAPVNLIVTISVTVGGENAFTYNDKKMTYEKLKMFARFPQGIPPNIEIADIK